MTHLSKYPNPAQAGPSEIRYYFGQSSFGAKNLQIIGGLPKEARLLLSFEFKFVKFVFWF